MRGSVRLMTVVFAANLEVNEKIKSDLNPVRINEPKTPYRGPMDADEEEDLGNKPILCCYGVLIPGTFTK
jgi:hypothetical protein